MKILMVTMAMNIGGAETHILELCRELHRRGEDVTLASHGGVYADELISLGVKHVSLPLYTKNPAAVKKSYKGLYELIKKERFDIVHAHARIPAFIVGQIAKKLTYDGIHFRFVTSAHLNFTVNPIWRHLSEWGEAVMAVSEDIRGYLEKEYSYPRSKVELTINGIDTEKFSRDIDFTPILELHSLSRDRTRIVYMSRLDEDRSEVAHRLINIAPDIAAKYPDTDIIIVGGGREFELISGKARLANEKAGRNIVTMAGAVSNTNEYCSSADIFIGVSRSALEAMSASKPVIVAGNQGSLGIFDETKVSDGIETNFCCRGFENATETELYRDISYLLELSPCEREKMGDYNRKFIEKYYTAARMADDYMRLYKKVLASPVRYKGSPDVLLSGYYGFGNLGDESLLESITAALAHEVGGVKIAALTKKPRKEEKKTGVKCIERFSIPAVIKNTKKSSLLISGGGSLLQDATSSRSLRYYAGVISLAKKSGTKVAVLANGIGPIASEKNRALTKKVISLADRVSVRDSDSKTELIGLGIEEEKIILSADPAFLIKAQEEDKTDALLSSLIGDRNSPFFAVSVRPYTKKRRHMSRKIPPLDKRDFRLIDELAKTVSNISEKYSLIPLVLVMQEAQDAEISRILCSRLRKYGGKYSSSASLYFPKSASELVGVLSRASFEIGMRLHALIFAASASTPVIGLEYDPKVRSLLSDIGAYSVSLSPADQNAGIEEKLMQYTDTVIANRGALGEAYRKKADEMRSRVTDDIARVAAMLRI